MSTSATEPNTNIQLKPTAFDRDYKSNVTRLQSWEIQSLKNALRDEVVAGRRLQLELEEAKGKFGNYFLLGLAVGLIGVQLLRLI